MRYIPDWEQTCSPALVLLSQLERTLAVYKSFLVAWSCQAFLRRRRRCLIYVGVCRHSGVRKC